MASPHRQLSAQNFRYRDTQSYKMNTMYKVYHKIKLDSKFDII